MKKDEIAELLESLLDVPQEGRIKTYSELLAEGIPHKGGLRMLADAERRGVLYGGPPVARPANDDRP